MSTTAIRLRIYVRESESWHGKALHLALIEAARDQGLAGATALRGLEGFGSNRRLHVPRLVDLDPKLPVIVEIVDEESRIEAFLPALAAMAGEALVTREQVEVLFSLRQHDAD